MTFERSMDPSRPSFLVAKLVLGSTILCFPLWINLCLYLSLRTVWVPGPSLDSSLLLMDYPGSVPSANLGG